MGDTKTYNIGSIENAQFFYQSFDYQKLTEKIDDKQELMGLLQAAARRESADVESGAPSRPAIGRVSSHQNDDTSD